MAKKLSKPKKIKDLYLKLMNTATGKLVNVLFYLLLSNAVAILTQYYSNIDLTGKTLTYVLFISSINIILVFLNKMVLPLFSKK